MSDFEPQIAVYTGHTAWNDYGETANVIGLRETVMKKADAGVALMTRIRTYAYLRHGTPVPEGAKVVSTFEGQHHRNYSVLIELPREKKDSAS